MMSDRALCNAPRSRTDKGTCKRPAGFGTGHAGEGRCYHHDGIVVSKRVGKAAPYLTKRAAELSLEDVSSLHGLGTRGLVMARSRLIERLMLDISAKESEYITISLTRIDAMLQRNPDPEAPPTPTELASIDEEMKRLREIEQELPGDKDA